jgi:hypothetical protein
VLSLGLFFTIVTLGLASRLPSHLYKGLVAAGVDPSAAHLVANEPPIGSLFSAFLGENPIQELLGPTGALKHLSPSQAAYITGRSFFPKLIEQPFAAGLHLAFTFAAIATAIAVVASALRGRRYLHSPSATEPLAEELAEGAAESAGLVGLDETAAVVDLDETAGQPGGNGNGNGASRRSRHGANGVRAAAPSSGPASSGPDGESGASSENT